MKPSEEIAAIEQSAQAKIQFWNAVRKIIPLQGLSQPERDKEMTNQEEISILIYCIRNMTNSILKIENTRSVAVDM
jgi:hypothetical protein